LNRILIVVGFISGVHDIEFDDWIVLLQQPIGEMFADAVLCAAFQWVGVV